MAAIPQTVERHRQSTQGDRRMALVPPRPLPSDDGDIIIEVGGVPPRAVVSPSRRRKGNRAMPSADFIPSGDAEFVIWLGNFVTKLATVYNGTFGITAAQITALNADYANMRYIIADYLPAFDAAKKNRVAYKDLMRNGKTEQGLPVPTTAQAVPSPTVAVPAAPATAVTFGFAVVGSVVELGGTIRKSMPTARV